MAGVKIDDHSVDHDVHITFEDQQKINKFARCNARLEELKDEMKGKENDLQNLQDAEDEMMIALDTDEKVPFMIGEVFIMKTQDQANDSIAEQRTILEQEKKDNTERAAELQGVMTQLKADLYAKFGNNINLEADEE